MAYQTGPVDLDALPQHLSRVNSQDLPARVRIGLDSDPARSVQGAPPNYGEDVVPQIMTYAGIYSSAARTYDITDEATRHSLENAERMRTELAIEECLERRRQALAGLPWHIEPEDPKSPRQREIAGVLTNLLERGPRFSRMVKTLALGIWFGRYAVALNYAFDIIGGQNRNVLRTWKPVHGDKLLMRYSDGTQDYADGQVGIRVSSMLIGKVPDRRIEPTQHGLAYFLHNWERELYCIYRHDIEDGTYWIPQDAGKVQGLGIRDKIYWTWLAMSSMEQDILTWISRAAYGVRIWRYPSGNAKAKAEVEAAIKNALSNGVADIMYPVVPGEDAALFGLEQIEPGTAGVQAVLDLIQGFYSKKIKRYILGQTVTSETDPEGIGGGAWQAKMSTFADIMREDAEAMSEVITLDYVRKLLRLNFPEYQNCYMRFVMDTDDPKVEERMAAVQALYQMDVPIVAEELYKLTGLTRPTPDDEVVQLSQTQQKQQAWRPGMQPQDAAGEAPTDEGLMPADQQQGPVVDAAGGEVEQQAAIPGGADVDVYSACPCPQGKCACQTMGGLQQWREEAAKLLPKSRGVVGKVAGFDVVAVDGDQVKTRHDMDFVEGGNHAVYPYVPEGQVWVDGALPPEQRRHVALHEAVEATLMLRHGWNYDEAHKAANRVEKAAREADQPDPESTAGQMMAAMTGGVVEDQLPGGAADGMPADEFDPTALAQGTEHEAEHTIDPAIAGEIARDHLAEDPAYYEKLEQVEGGGLREQMIAALTGQAEKYAARHVKSSPGQKGLFDPEDHPRAPEGAPGGHGGEFVEKEGGGGSAAAKGKSVKQKAYRTEFPGRTADEYGFIQRAQGRYVALDKPWNQPGGVVSEEDVEFDPSTIHDPNGVLDGTDKEKSRKDEQTVSDGINARRSEVKTPRDIAKIRTELLQGMGYSGEAGWIDGPERGNRELVLFEKSRGSAAAPHVPPEPETPEIDDSDPPEVEEPVKRPEPKRPTGLAFAEFGSDEHNQAVDAATKKVHGKIDDAKGLTPEQRNTCKTVVSYVFKRMAPQALHRFNYFCNGECIFHESFDALNALAKKVIPRYRKSGQQLGGVFFVLPALNKGTIHLEGGFTPEHQTEIYAHEFAHAIDGATPANQLSETSPWQDAWKDEIKSGGLSDYATTDASEGFAEFYRLVVTQGNRQAKEKYPKCFAFFESKRLI